MPDDGRSRSPQLRRTERLLLTAVAESDLDELYALHSDPRVWEHLPSGRHTTRERTARDVAEYRADWSAGLGYWVARCPDGTFVGIGGVRRRPPGVLNLYYRLVPEQQRQGYALEIARAALAVAAEVAPQAPVTAFLLEHNAGSRAVAERLSLTRVWRGPDAGNPDPQAVRLVYADRPLTDSQLAALVG